MLKKENLILLGIFVFVLILTTVSQFEAKNRLAIYIENGGDKQNTSKEDSGKKINVPLNKFNKILIRDSAKIRITGGSNYEIICTDKEKLISNLTMEDDVVVIFGDSEFLLRANELVSIEVSGKATVNLSDFIADSLFLICGKQASITASKCDVRKLNIKSSGISSILYKETEKNIDTVNIDISEQSLVELYSDVRTVSGNISGEGQFFVEKAGKIEVRTEKNGLRIFNNQKTIINQ